MFNNDDEYLTRKETAKISLKAIVITLVAAIVLAIINRDDLVLMLVSFIGVLVVAENITERMVTKIEDGLYQVQVVAWYDNENSYTSQMVRTIKYFAELG